MTLELFAQTLRLNRGRLTKHNEDIRDIYLSGTPALREFALTKKLMGIKNIRWIAIQTTEYQTKFTDWMSNRDWKTVCNRQCV